MARVAVIAALAVASCSTAPAPTPIGVAPAVTDSTLSVLSRTGGSCVWRRVDPVAGTDVELARVAAPCEKIRTAWSPDGTRAMLRVPATLKDRVIVYDAYLPEEQDATPREILEIDLASATTRSLPLPAGDVREIAYVGNADLISFSTEQRIPSSLLSRLRSLLSLPVAAPTDEAHAQRFEKGRWRTIQSVDATGDWNALAGLATYQSIGEHSPYLTDDGPMTTRGKYVLAHRPDAALFEDTRRRLLLFSSQPDDCEIHFWPKPTAPPAAAPARE